MMAANRHVIESITAAILHEPMYPCKATASERGHPTSTGLQPGPDGCLARAGTAPSRLRVALGVHGAGGEGRYCPTAACSGALMEDTQRESVRLLV